jgi:chromosome segregation ATPase
MIGFLTASATYAPTPGTPIWVTILIALCTLVGGGLGWNVYKRWRTGASEDALQISQAAIEQARGAKDLFVEYRVELEAAQRQIAEYLDQLIQVNRMLGEATARIARLEEELRTAHAEHQDLKQQLEEANRIREESERKRDLIIKRMEELQRRVHELEGPSQKPSVQQGLT